MPVKKCRAGCTCGKHKRSMADRQKISEGKIRQFLEREAQPHTPSKTKVCSLCKKRKRVWPIDESEFNWIFRELKSGVVKRYPRPHCRKCDAERKRRWRRRHPESEREIRRRLSKKRRKNPGRLKRHRQYQREWAASKRREQGVPVRGPRTKHRDSPRSDTLLVGPIQAWLTTYIEMHSLSRQEVAERLEVDERRLSRILSGYESNGKPIVRVTSDFVDKVLQAFGRQEMMPILYPPED